MAQQRPKSRVISPPVPNTHERTGLRPNTYRVLDRAVEQGIGYGWHRAHKHDEHPSPEYIQEQIQQAVMNEIAEWFEFE